MPRSNLRLYVICPNEGDHFFDKVYEGAQKAEEELSELGVTVEYLHSKYNNVSRQTQLLSEIVDSKPDGIAIVPASTTELNKFIDEAVDNDIPVVTFNNDAPYSKRFCYIGPDNYSSGRLCGELMSKFLCNEGKILVFSASNDVYASKQKLLGFKDRIKSSYPKMKILKSINYADDEETCYNLITKELKHNPEINGIYATSGTSSIAISQALKDLDLASSPKFIGYDPSKILSPYMIDGYVNALIYQDPFTQGYLSLKVLYDFVAHGIVPEKETLNTKIEIVVQENLENFIDTNI